MYYSEEFDEYFNDLDDIKEYIENNCIKPYPSFVWLKPCKKFFGSLISPEHLLQEFFELSVRRIPPSSVQVGVSRFRIQSSLP